MGKVVQKFGSSESRSSLLMHRSVADTAAFEPLRGDYAEVACDSFHQDSIWVIKQDLDHEGRLLTAGRDGQVF